MSRHPLLALALALALAGLAPTPSFADLSLTVAEFDSPTFAGGSFLQYFGSTQTISLTPGVPMDVFLDSGAAIHYANTGNTFTGTATSDITLGGIMDSISYNYSFTDTAFDLPALTGGSAIVFNFGTYEVTVTPESTSNGLRRASFLETPLSSVPVPEPSMLWIATLGGAGFAVCGWRRARRARAAT
jgi:hypothetical protein